MQVILATTFLILILRMVKVTHPGPKYCFQSLRISALLFLAGFALYFTGCVNVKKGRSASGEHVPSPGGEIHQC
jgi:hypothetical protein